MSFTVSLQPSGREFVVERDESILDAALREGLRVPYGCRNGTCHSCRGKIIEGEVNYRGGPPKALTETMQANGFALLCQAVPHTDLVIEAEEFSTGADNVIRTLPCRVMSKTLLAHDVMALGLRLPEGERLQYLPGQYIDILMRDGRRRSFSIANAPRADDSLSLHIRQVPDGEFSSYVFNHLKERALIRIRGPLGGFFVRETSERELVFVAGGTGFAPINSILESMLEGTGERQVHLYWGVRDRRDLYLHERAQGWQQHYTNFHYTPVLSEPTDTGWTGRTGFVHQAVLDDFENLSDVDVYSSGPPVMIDAAWETFGERGLPADQHFSDAFEFAYETGADTL